MNDYDVIIAGAGMVGGSLALSLAAQGMRIAVVERRAAPPVEVGEPAHIRVSALSLASEQLLRALGLWQQLPHERLAAYRRLSVWEHGALPVTFDANDIDQPRLGTILENDVLQQAIWQQLQHNELITLYTPAQISQLENSEQGVAITLNQGQQVSARLAVAADGAHSQLRQLAGIGTTAWQYRQQAMVLTVRVADGPYQETWQRFTATGPQAFLPLFGDYASLVWYHQPQAIEHMKNLADEPLTALVQEHFPSRLPAFSIVERSSFALTRQHANRYGSGSVLVVGDAAHTINPLAGQGVNIGLQDVSALVEILAETHREGNWEHGRLVRRYEWQRRPANLAMMSAMDGFYLAFSNEQPLLKRVRKAALSAVGKAHPLRTWVARYACGL